MHLNSYDLEWSHMTSKERLRCYTYTWVIESGLTWNNLEIISMIPSTYRIIKEHLNIFLLPSNCLVRKMTWPQVTEIKILKYTFCRHRCPHQLMKVSCWSLKPHSAGGISCPLPDFLNISKTAADIDAKLSVPFSSPIWRIPSKLQSKLFCENCF